MCRLGAAVLSHHVDEFSLVSAFFLFSIGCLNILLGLIFREKAKVRRAIASWRETDEALPRTSLTSGPRPFLTAARTGGSGTSAWDEKGAEATRSGTLLSQKSGMGFGRQGEKAALARGAYIPPLCQASLNNLADLPMFAGHTLTRPQEALPSYAPRPTAVSPAPTYISRSVRYAKTADDEAEPASGPRPVSVVSYADEDEDGARAV